MKRTLLRNATIVSMDPEIGDILVRLLARQGHAARHARDGREAWDILSRDLGAFDLVVTDHHMPALGGADLVGLLRQARFAGRIIVYSSSLLPPERARYELLGVNSIVEKSAVAAELIAAVEGS